MLTMLKAENVADMKMNANHMANEKPFIEDEKPYSPLSDINVRYA